MRRGPDPAVIRRERRMGNWGRASEHIGKRWEEIGLERLRELLEGRRPWPRPGWQPAGWVVLSADDSMQTALSRLGLPSPDVVVGLAGEDGSRALQAVDMKWHIEFASYRQISANSLRELIAKGTPSLREQIEEHLGDIAEEATHLDGLLFAPDIPDNRYFLSSPRNLRQEYPIEPQDVIFEPVDGQVFFSALPGWEMALLLMKLDRAPAALRTVEGAERYYRLGAGLQGAAAQLLSSVFLEEPLPVEAARAFDWLLKTFRAPTASLLAQEVDRMMAQRTQMLTRLRELMRSPYRLGDLAQTLRKLGLPMPVNIEEDSPQAATCREVLRQVALRHREAVRGAGLDLVQKGASDAQALATIAREAGHFRSLAQATAERLAAQHCVP